MFYVEKRLEISAAHRLALDYGSKCSAVHGHNWIVTVCCRANELDQNGMVYDFTHIKAKVHGVLDHAYLNEILPCNPTAEHIARWIAEQVGPKCYKVVVQESEGNVATYEVEA